MGEHRASERWRLELGVPLMESFSSASLSCTCMWNSTPLSRASSFAATMYCSGTVYGACGAMPHISRSLSRLWLLKNARFFSRHSTGPAAQLVGNPKTPQP